MQEKLYKVEHTGHMCTMYLAIASVLQSSCCRVQDEHESAKNLWEFYIKAVAASMHSVENRCGVI